MTEDKAVITKSLSAIKFIKTQLAESQIWLVNTRISEADQALKWLDWMQDQYKHLLEEVEKSGDKEDTPKKS